MIHWGRAHLSLNQPVAISERGAEMMDRILSDQIKSNCSIDIIDGIPSTGLIDQDSEIEGGMCLICSLSLSLLDASAGSVPW